MIRIQFLRGDAPDFADCTSYQAETYRVTRELLASAPRVKTAAIMQRLNIRDIRSFYARLTHLQEKGYLRWGKSQTATA
jgi:hypothetical protein